jgi:hypothetical protein
MARVAGEEVPLGYLEGVQPTLNYRLPDLCTSILQCEAVLFQVICIVKFYVKSGGSNHRYIKKIPLQMNIHYCEFIK